MQTDLIPQEDPRVDAGALIAQAINSGMGVEAMERLLAMRRELQQEAARTAFFAALSAFQAECPEIHKTRKVHGNDGSVRYRYAALDDIVAAVKSLLKKHGFSYTIETMQAGDAVTATARLHHAEGHSESSSFTVPVDKAARMNAPQQAASALTYAKRYAFLGVTGIMTADEDNDALTFDDGVRYARYIDRLQEETDLQKLRAIAKEAHRELGEAGDTTGQEVMIKAFERRKAELAGGQK